jgi:hypothetical protein
MVIVPSDGDGHKPEHHINATFDLFHTPDSPLNIRGIRKGGGAGNTFAGDRDTFVSTALRRDQDSGLMGVYVTLNPLMPDVINNGGGAKDKDVRSRRWLLIDCDPERPDSDSASTDEEKHRASLKLQEVRDFLGSMGLPEPVVADSGNGYHALYRIELPANDGGLVQRVLAALGALFSDEHVKIDTSVYNPARITKLYGTMVRKGDNTQERPHRRSYLMCVPDTLEPVSRGLLEQVAGLVPAPPPAKQGTKPQLSGKFDVAAFFDKHDVPVLAGPTTWDGGGAWDGSTKWIVECPFGDHEVDRAAHVIQNPEGAISMRCKHDRCQGNGENRWHEFRKHYEPEYAPTDTAEAPNRSANKPEKRNQADRLIDYAKETGAELFVDHLGAPHALVDGEAVALNSRCYPWLRELLWEHEQRSATREALGQAAGTLAAFALHSGVEHELHTRAAFHDGAVYYQLGKGRVVKIDESGWRIASDPPVLFRSIANLKDLPDPVRGGSLAPLHDLVNLKDERDRRLFDTYMTLLPLADIPRPMLQPTGQQGSGKTTLSRIVKRTLDPSAPEAVRLDPREFLQKAAHAYIIMLDNQPNLPEWAADTLCRLVTGESDSKRQLYTDDEDVIVEMRRAVLINGINTPSDRGDVQERTLPLELERIPKTQRRSERVMWGEFDKAHAGVLGAIFDALSATLRIHGTLTFGDLPRMADWAEYAIAAYEHFCWGARQFVEDWSEIEGRQNQGAIEGSAVAQTIIEIMKVHTRFEKTSSELLEALEAEAEKLKINVKRDKQWPGSPKWLWRRIKEVLPALGAYGISASKSENRSGSKIVLTLDPPGGNSPGGGGNRNSVVATTVATPDPADTAENGNSGNSGNRSGHMSPSFLGPVEKIPPREPAQEAKTKPPRQTPENDATVAMLPPDESDTRRQQPRSNSITGDPNDPRNFSTLSEAQKDTLLEWIDKNIKPGAKTSLSSYDLKHYFEASEGGFYIDNGQFKGAMRHAGFEPMDLDGDGINWYFRVSQNPTGPRRP